MLTYPYCEYASLYKNAYCNTQTMINHLSYANVASRIDSSLITGMLNAYVPPQPKSGRKVYRDLGDCWIVIAYESGPLKLLELELK